jgi:hypothetical protein
MPAEVEKMMAAIAADGAVKVRSTAPASKELFSSPSPVEARPRSEGFGASRIIDTTAEEVSSISDDKAASEIVVESKSPSEPPADEGEESSGGKRRRKSGKKGKR